MNVPANLIYTQGTGAAPITADGLNTFLQTVPTLAAARGFSGVNGMEMTLQGYSAANDGGQGNFVWVTGTGTDDGGATTIVPTGNTAGYWSRIVNVSTLYTPQNISSATGVTLTAANVANQVLVHSGAAAVTDTFPSAPAIIAAIIGATTGVLRDLLVINVNSGTLLLAPGSGVTFSGNLSTGNFSIATVTQRLLKINITGPTTVTVYG